MLAPTWDIWIDAAPPPLNGLQAGEFKLCARSNPRRGVEVFERSGQTRFPNYCPERHINFGGGFCLGHQERRILDLTEANCWWHDLHQFLLLQAIAEQTRYWPAAHALSHGTAADHEIKAREAARNLGIEADYVNLLDGKQNWISKALEDAHPHDHSLSLEWRRQHAPKDLRCSAQIWARSMAPFVAAERKRQHDLYAFWEDEIRRGRRCCGSMAACPLRASLSTTPLLKDSATERANNVMQE